MPRLPFFKLGRETEDVVSPRLKTFIPSLPLENLQVGVDNLRYDVYLSPKFVEQMRNHLQRLLVRHGGVDELMAAQAATKTSSHFISGPNSKTPPKPEATDLKTTLSDLHVAALNRAKAASNPVLDLLARAAIIKFLRVALNSQFGQILERCRALLKTYEGIRPQRALEYRERVGEFQVAKKIILRKTGQELFRTLRDIEKETLARTRRSLFGNANDETYKLFLNPLLFTEDGHDTYLNAEHYVMFGNFDRDPDRFANVRRVVCEFVTSLRINSGGGPEPSLDSWLNVPENAQELVGGGGVPDENTPEGRSQKARLADWVGLLEREQLMDYVVASYEVASLLAEYSPRINAQQLKNALISREECARVEKLIQEHGKLSPDSLHGAIGRVINCRGLERSKMAGRFLRDVLRYHRDLRQLEVLNATLDSINLISKDKIRELSSVNGTLYQFLLADEQKPTEEKIVRHVIVKADIRDSSRLTRSLMERGMNPASYFSLNFYDPVNKLLSKYGATKVFLEGDAIILALLERESEPGLAVGRAAVLAREIIEIVRGYNQLVERAGLPGIELGIGISYQDSAPMYLMDGDQRIMISDALNESDRLSSCSKRVRKAFKASQTPFNVYAFQTASDEGIEDSPEDFLLKYNVSGIRMSEAAFRKLQQEISLAPGKIELPNLPKSEEFKLWSGLVPLGSDIFRKIVVRGGRVPHVDARSFTVQQWTDQWYYEVCSNPAIYSALEGKAAAGKK